MAFASPVVIDDCSASITLNIYAHLVGTEHGHSPNHVHGFKSLMQFLCTHKQASRMVGLNCPEALCTPEVRVRELGLEAKPRVKKPWPGSSEAAA
jgi:hypothetical protein